MSQALLLHNPDVDVKQAGAIAIRRPFNFVQARHSSFKMFQEAPGGHEGRERGKSL